MKYTILLFLSVLMVNIGCKQKTHSLTPLAWSTITIVSEYSTVITINNENDTSMVDIAHTGSFFSPLPKNTKVKVDTIKAYFTVAEKDTLFSLVKQLITEPVNTNKFCTEYVGSLELIIDYGRQFKQIGMYSSVCNWNVLSDTTKH